MSVQVASAPQVNGGRAAAPLAACGPGRRILAHSIDLAAVGAVTAAAYLPTGSVLLGAVVLLMLYNGKRGKWDMKSLFYFYYPAHLAGIYLIDFLINT